MSKFTLEDRDDDPLRYVEFWEAVRKRLELVQDASTRHVEPAGKASSNSELLIDQSARDAIMGMPKDADHLQALDEHISEFFKGIVNASMKSLAPRLFLLGSTTDDLEE